MRCALHDDVTGILRRSFSEQGESSLIRSWPSQPVPGKSHPLAEGSQPVVSSDGRRD